MDEGHFPPAIQTVQTIWNDVVGRGCDQPFHSSALEKAALAILWMAVRGEDLPDLLATTFAEAAGLAGKHCWGLVLSSSARVTLMTYQTVVGVRYPELVLPGPDTWNFGRFLLQRGTLCGGFLPVFWDVPRARMHAVGDIGSVVDWLCAIL